MAANRFPLISSNPIEFDGIEIGIIQLFPNAEKLDGIAVAQPVLNDVVRSLAVLVPRNIGYADVVIALLRHYRDGGALYIKADLFGRQRLVLHTSSWSCELLLSTLYERTKVTPFS
jgi:hypothetical protein